MHDLSPFQCVCFIIPFLFVVAHRHSMYYNQMILYGIIYLCYFWNTINVDVKGCKHISSSYSIWLKRSRINVWDKKKKYSPVGFGSKNKQKGAYKSFFFNLCCYLLFFFPGCWPALCKAWCYCNRTSVISTAQPQVQ